MIKVRYITGHDLCLYEPFIFWFELGRIANIWIYLYTPKLLLPYIAFFQLLNFL